MAARLVEYSAFLLSLTLAKGNITSLCGTSDSYWEVQENKQDNTFTCTGLSANDTVEWVAALNSSSVPLGSCPPRPSNGSKPVCDLEAAPVFKPDRTSDDTSVMVVNDIAASALHREIFSKRRLVCQVDAPGLLPGLLPPTASCRMDYIYASESASCTVQFRQDSWTVFGQCSVKKARSAQNRYRCQWIHSNESSRDPVLIANISMSVVPVVGTNYVSGSCNFTSELPPEGKYTYRVTVVPGEVTVNATFNGINEIRPPSKTANHTCPQYVPEGSDLNCMCFVSDPGSPPGVLQWNSSQSAQLYLPNVQAGYSQTHVCQLVWNRTVVQLVQYNVNVAYGPRNVTPVVLNPQPFDTNGSQSISLNCLVSGSNPPTNIVSWIRSRDQSILCNSQLCNTTLKPPDDDGVKVECVARNPVTNRTYSSSVTVTLNYPPTSPPVISRNASVTDSQPVYEGDNVTLTCTVQGGKPVNATVITFTCPDKTDMPDNSVDAVNITTSSLTFAPVSSSNHGNCFCNGTWKNYDWYNKRVNWSLVVYTPPSVPVIFPAKDTTERLMYPFMEGTNGTLYCRSNQTGRPEATYTWPDPASGHVSGSNLNFYQLTREDNGRVVQCRASNSYTELRRPVDDATFVLDIYYEPVVNFTDVSDTNNCSALSTKSNYTQCVVAEGQRVHINCTADSNPSPATFQWTGKALFQVYKASKIYSNTSELMITSANDTIHSGDYNCTVVTERKNNDSRLPLTSSAVLTVLVGYSPRNMNITINGMDSKTVSVIEKSYVHMECLCEGRPVPTIQLIRAANASQFLNESHPTDEISAGYQTGEASFSKDNVLCEDSGVYTCEGQNALGFYFDNRTLLVLCAPRQNTPVPKPPNITTTGGKGELNFSVTAYPTPVVKNIIYHGEILSNISDGSPVKEHKIQAECSASSIAPAAATCHIVVSNITYSDRGYYTVVFNNSFGEMPFTFLLEAAPVNGPVNGTELKIGAIVGGIIAVLAVITIAIIIVTLWRRRFGKKEHPEPRTMEDPKIEKKEDDEIEMTVNDTYSGSDSFAISSKTAQNTSGVYEDVSVGASLNQPSKTFPKRGNGRLNNNEHFQQDSAGDKEDTENSSINKLSKKQLGSKGNAAETQAGISDEISKGSKRGKFISLPPPLKRKPRLEQDVSSSFEKEVRTKSSDGKYSPKKKEKQKMEGEALLSMDPIEGTAYENFAFETAEKDPEEISARGKKETTDSAVRRNKDGLIYSDLEFDKKKSDKPPPPKRDRTDYVFIDLQKTASMQLDVNTNI